MKRKERQKQIAMKIAKRLNHSLFDGYDGFVHQYYNEDDYPTEPSRFKNYKNYIRYYKNFI